MPQPAADTTPKGQTDTDPFVALEISPEPETTTPDHEAAVSSPAAGVVRRGVRRVWKSVKIGAAVLVLVGLAASVYFGWPVVNERYIEPIRSNTAGVTDVQGRVDAGEAQITALEAQVAALTAADAGVPGRLESLEASATALESAQAALDGRLTAVETQIEASTRQLARLDDLQQALAADATVAADQAAHEVAVLRSMELMSRARLFLYQANYGLAEADIQAARDILADQLSSNPEFEAVVIAEAVFRLEKALDSLPERPVAGADDLDIAWLALLGEIPDPGPAETTDQPAAGTGDATTSTSTP